jgi:hypothetical protein
MTNGFDRYMLYTPEGVPVFESSFASGISEQKAWDEAFDIDAGNEFDALVSLWGDIEDGDEVEFSDFAKQHGWRMVLCRPTPIRESLGTAWVILKPDGKRFYASTGSERQAWTDRLGCFAVYENGTLEDKLRWHNMSRRENIEELKRLGYRCVECALIPKEQEEAK